MSVASKYKQASFRGVPFLIKSESEEAGKKVAIHEYPNSDRRFVEELGALPSSFSMAALVHGERAVEQSSDLIRALTLPGLGVLVHPIYGRIEVKATTFKRSTVETEMGEITFEINFEKSESNMSLSPILSTSSSVSSAADVARKAGFNALSIEMIINKSKEAMISTQKVTRAAMQVANGNFRSLGGPDASSLATFDRVFKASMRNLYLATQSRGAFTTLLENFYTAARAIVGPAGQKKAWEDLTTYGQNRRPTPITTAIRLAQEKNAAAINSHTRINALINLYESVAYTTFTTDQEILAAQKFLSDTFDTLFGDSSDDGVSSNQELRAAILDLRTVTGNILDSSSNNVFKLRDLQPGGGSMPLFTYQYYGSLDLLDTLLELNPEQNWA